MLWIERSGSELYVLLMEFLEASRSSFSQFIRQKRTFTYRIASSFSLSPSMSNLKSAVGVRESGTFFLVKADLSILNRTFCLTSLSICNVVWKSLWASPLYNLWDRIMTMTRVTSQTPACHSPVKHIDLWNSVSVVMFSKSLSMELFGSYILFFILKITIRTHVFYQLMFLWEKKF